MHECDDNRTLVVKVDVQVDVQAIKHWRPPSNLVGSLTKLYQSKEGADVCFNVNGARIVAHKCILSMQNSNLAELAVESGTEIPLTDMDPDLFETMILFHYTEEIPSNFNVENAVDLLKLADKYGVVNLKMTMEAIIVESKTLLSQESCIELLLLADTHNCALLREAAVGMVVSHMPQIMESKEWEAVLREPTLVHDIMLCQVSRSGAMTTGKTHKLDKFRVATLRKRAHEKGLDVEGSRKVLIKRLKEAEESPDEVKD